MAYKDKVIQREYQRQWQRKRNTKIRQAVIKMLGNACKSCGFDDIRALQIDHIEPVLRNPEEYLNKIETGTYFAYRIFIGQIPLETIQLLCANCHSIKTYDIDRAKFKSSRIDQY